MIDSELRAALEAEEAQFPDQFEWLRARSQERSARELDLLARRRNDRAPLPSRPGRARRTLAVAAAMLAVSVASATATAFIGSDAILDRLKVFGGSNHDKPTRFTVDGASRGLPAELGLEKPGAARRLIDEHADGRSVVMDATATSTGNACFSVAITIHGSEDRIAGCSKKLSPEWPIQESISVGESWYSIQGFMGNEVSRVRVTSVRGVAAATLGPNGYVWVSEGLDDRPVLIELTLHNGRTLTRPFTQLDGLERGRRAARAMSNCVLRHTIPECEANLDKP